MNVQHTDLIKLELQLRTGSNNKDRLTKIRSHKQKMFQVQGKKMMLLLNEIAACCYETTKLIHSWIDRREGAVVADHRKIQPHELE